MSELQHSCMIVGVRFAHSNLLYYTHLWQRVKEFEDNLKAEAAVLALSQTSRQMEKSPSVDVLQTLAQLAQPMGIADLSHHFDEYTRRILPDEITP